MYFTSDRWFVCIFQFGFVLLVAVAAASRIPDNQPEYNSYKAYDTVDPYKQEPYIKILTQQNDQDQYGNYKYGYKQDNGQEVNKWDLKLYKLDWKTCARQYFSNNIFA